MNKYFAALLCLLFTFQTSFSQLPENRFRHFSALEGLSGLSVQDITQDCHGFIWIGTTEGLYRYDGYHFKLYRSHLNDTTSLVSNNITELLYDSKKRLWIATRYGLSLYNEEKDNFHRFLENDSIEGTLGNNLVDALYEDPQERIWLGHFKGIDRILFKNGKISGFENHYLSFDTKRDHPWVTSMLHLEGDTFWLGTFNSGLAKINIKNDKIIKRYFEESRNNNYRILDIIKDNYNRTWVGIFNGGSIQLYHPESDTFQQFSFKKRYSKVSSNAIKDMMHDSLGNIFCATDEGVAVYNYIHDTVTRYYYEVEHPNGISSGETNCIFRDKDGGFWVGTHGAGVNYSYNNYLNINRIYSSNYPQIKNDIVLTIEKVINSGIVFGTKGSGAYHYNPRKDSVYSFYNPKGWVDYLFSDSRGRVYFNKKNKKIRYYNVETKTVQVTNFHHNKIFSVFDEDSRGLLYFLCKPYVLGYIDYEKDTLVSYNFRPYFKNYPNYLSLKNIYIDPEDNLWILSEDGVFRVHSLNRKEIEHALPVKNNNKNLISNPDKILFRKHGEYFLASSDNLYLFHSDTKKIESFIEDEPYIGEMIYGIVMDRKNNLWISHSKGISTFREEEGSFLHFNSKDGVFSYGFSSNAIGADDFGNLYFGTNEGIIMIQPEKYRRNKDIPNIVFTNIKVFNKSLEIATTHNRNNNPGIKKQINLLDEVVLRYNQNFVTLNFAALNYNKSTKNQYAYFLDGLEENWNYVGEERTATYAGLTPGKYIFHVKASNNDGYWNEQGRSLRIIILPPFWQTWWFRILLTTMLLSFIVSIYFIRLRSMKKRQLELEIMVRERTAEVVQQKEEISTQHDNLREVNALLQEHQEEIQAQAEELFEANVELQKLNSTKDKFFSIIAHDLKNPFHAISGFSDMLLKDFDEIQHEKAREFLTVIRNSSKTASSLLENLLTWARTQTNKVQHNPQTIDFHNIAQENTNLLKANANNKNIALSNNVKQGTFIFADNNMITTVIRNLVNNAIKFTPGGGKVTISAKQADTHIEIAVSDTGVGIDEISRNKLFKIDQQHTTSGTSGEEGTGLGLVICKEFVEKNEGEIRIESTPGKGSSFIINLPASNQNMSIAEPEKKIEKPVIETQPEKIIHTNNPDEDTNTDKPIVLIIDDSNDIRLHIKANLEKKYKTVEAKNGNEGEKFAFDIIPDLIISDWMMPQMDGIKLAQKLKNDERTSHIPIIMLTAKSTASSQVEGLETGADDFITKPFDNNVLKARVKNLIQSRRKLQEKFAGVTKDYVQPSEIKVSSIDEKFIKKAIGAVEKNMSDQQFDTEELGKTIGMSRAQLYRKLTAVTGQSPSKFIRTLRVKRAAQLLEQDGGNISEVMYMVGFNNRSYFAKCFKEVFGVIPSEYKK